MSADDDCARRLKLLANDIRLAVLRSLMHGAKHVGEINQSLSLEQSRLSHHLLLLREAGLVVAERDGKAMLYRLADGVEAVGADRAIDLGCCRLHFD